MKAQILYRLDGDFICKMFSLPSTPFVYTTKDAKKLFIKRSELIADLGICEAFLQEKSVNTPVDIVKHLQVLRCYISIIDSLLCIVNYSESFVIRSRLIDGMDWPQIATRYNQLWGKEDGLSIRALQLRLRSGIIKVTCAMNKRSKVPWKEILDAPSCWSSIATSDFPPASSN